MSISSSVTIIGMIYRSVPYLDFMVRGMLATPGASHLIVANDATPEVLAALLAAGLPHLDYRDRKPGDYYLNRVYRAWNAGAAAASGSDVIVFVNSDMWPADGWLDRLLARLDRGTIPCSRLIESGKIPSGEHAIVRDFGRTPSAFRRQEFAGFADSVAAPRTEPGGLYMPCAFYRDEFLQSGGYPEGNIHRGGPGAVGTRFVRSGDDHFFHHNPAMAGKQHVTVFDSLVYHLQEGEKDE